MNNSIQTEFIFTPCLVGEGQLSIYDKDVLKRIEDIEHLPGEDKKHLFYAIDNFMP